MAIAERLGVRRCAMLGAPPASRPLARECRASVAMPRRASSLLIPAASRRLRFAPLARPGQALAQSAAAVHAPDAPHPTRAASLLGGLAVPLTLFAAAAGMGGPLNGALLLGVYGAHLAAAAQAHSALLRQLGVRARPLATLLASLLALRLYWHWAMAILPPQLVVGVTVKHQLHMPLAWHRLLAGPAAAAWAQAHRGLPALAALSLATGAALLAAEGLGRALGAALRLLAPRRGAAAAAEAAPPAPDARQALREWAPAEADGSPVARLRSAGHADAAASAEQPQQWPAAAAGERASLSAADVRELCAVCERGDAASAALSAWLERRRAGDPAFARALSKARAARAPQARPGGSPYWTLAESEALRARAARRGDAVTLAWLAQQRGGGGGAAELAAALERGEDWDSEEEQEQEAAAASAPQTGERGAGLPRWEASEAAESAQAEQVPQPQPLPQAVRCSAGSCRGQQQGLASPATRLRLSGRLQAPSQEAAEPAAEGAGQAPQPAQLQQEQEQAQEERAPAAEPEAADAFVVPIKLLPPAQPPAPAAPEPRPASETAQPRAGGGTGASKSARQLAPEAAREDGFAVPIQTAPEGPALPATEAPDAGEGQAAAPEAAAQPAAEQLPAEAGAPGKAAGKEPAAAAAFELPVTEAPDADELGALRQRCRAAHAAAKQAARRVNAAARPQGARADARQLEALQRASQEAWRAFRLLKQQLQQAEAAAAAAARHPPAGA